MSPSSKAHAELNPRTTTYEFFGPVGAFAVSIGVPSLLYILYFACNETNGCPPPDTVLVRNLVNSVTDISWWKSLWDTEATIIYFGWYTFCVVAWFVLPGDWVPGAKLRTGGKISYKINAFSTLLLSVGLTIGHIVRSGPQAFTFLYEKWIGFVTASLLMSVLQAFAVYAMSFQQGKLLALGGNSGNPIYDWYIGRELNPAIGSFDIKTFNELRPGLILWVLIDISMACEQAVRRGGSITDSMWLVLLFQTWYVADGLYNEPALFTTMDVVSDGFGFMLSVGDLAWVPFIYSLQARYLAFQPLELGIFASLAILGVKATGYWIFRSSNGEKNDFRNGRNPKNLKFMETASGSKLLTSGWWAVSRHPNYLGDLIMALSWSLTTGFDTPVTYFYPAYFTVLLVHRQLRDEDHCSEKYGQDWEKYKQLVPYRIFPYIY